MCALLHRLPPVVHVHVIDTSSVRDAAYVWVVVTLGSHVSTS